MPQCSSGASSRTSGCRAVGSRSRDRGEQRPHPPARASSRVPNLPLVGQHPRAPTDTVHFWHSRRSQFRNRKTKNRKINRSVKIKPVYFSEINSATREKSVITGQDDDAAGGIHRGSHRTAGSERACSGGPGIQCVGRPWRCVRARYCPANCLSSKRLHIYHKLGSYRSVKD